MPTTINDIPDKKLVVLIAFADDRKNLTLSRKKISNKFPIIGTEKDVTEIIVRSNILILLKSKKPGKRVK